MVKRSCSAHRRFDKYQQQRPLEGGYRPAPLTGPDGLCITGNSSLSNYDMYRTMISGSSKNPELAFRFCDGLFASEEIGLMAGRGFVFLCLRVSPIGIEEGLTAIRTGTMIYRQYTKRSVYCLSFFIAPLFLNLSGRRLPLTPFAPFTWPFFITSLCSVIKKGTMQQYSV